MKRTQIIALAVLLVVTLGLAWLFLAMREAPLIPGDPVHVEWRGGEACQECHGPDGVDPQPDSHPVGVNCVQCHGRE